MRAKRTYPLPNSNPVTVLLIAEKPLKHMTLLELSRKQIFFNFMDFISLQTKMK